MESFPPPPPLQKIFFFPHLQYLERFFRFTRITAQTSNKFAATAGLFCYSAEYTPLHAQETPF